MTENIITDPVLGELTALDAFQHGRHFPAEGRDIMVAIETAEGLTPEALAQARRIVGALADFTRRSQRFAAESLLALRNETWRRDDAPALTVSEVELQLSLEACEVAADGTATLYLADGDLFGGHSVAVYVGPEGDFVDAKLAG